MLRVYCIVGCTRHDCTTNIIRIQPGYNARGVDQSALMELGVQLLEQYLLKICG